MISSALSTSGKAGKPETWAGSPSHSGIFGQKTEVYDATIRTPAQKILT
jgi:hypothetical protein